MSIQGIVKFNDPAESGQPRNRRGILAAGAQRETLNF